MGPMGVDMGSCCQNKSCELEQIKKSQSKVLWIVLTINAIMFFAEFIGGWMAKSIALTSDSLDMLGDAIAYGSSLYVIHRGMRMKALAAMLKGAIMVTSAVAVLVQAIYKMISLSQPQLALMSGMTFAALIANTACLILLTRHKNDDINMSSVWICSRNDLIANTSVLAAAGLVHLTQSPWPDIIMGLALSLLFLKSGLSVIQLANKATHTPILQ